MRLLRGRVGSLDDILGWVLMKRPRCLVNHDLEVVMRSLLV